MLPVESLNGLVTFVTTARSATFTEAAETTGDLAFGSRQGDRAAGRAHWVCGCSIAPRGAFRSPPMASAYFASCATALEEIASAEACTGSASHLPAGRLRIDMPSSFGRLMILPVLLRICAGHPELQLTMTFTDHFVDPVEEGIDLLIRFGGLDQAQHLVARRLGTQQLITCASPAYLDRHGTPATVDDLHAHRSIVGYRYGQPVAWRIGEDAGQARFIPSGTHQLNDGDAVIEAAIAGLGICQMPHFLVKRHLQTGALQQVLGHCMQHHVEIHALWPQTRHLRPKVRYVVDALATLADAGAFD
ncbi:LysR substrate-binding domain-containing protein [Stenotrophomonas rhizophila]